MKRFVAMLAAGVALTVAADVDWNDRAVRQQAVLETAYAYYLKADCVQYGSVPLTVRAAHSGDGMAYSRRTKEGTPEDATPDSTYYTVCSSFTYETYFNAIGYRHSGDSDTSVTILLTTRPQEAVVFDYDKRLDPDGSKYEPEMMRMRSLLEVGDILVYSTIKGNDPKTGETLGGGHALLFVGDVAGDGHQMVMHSGGAKYQFEKGGYDQVEKSGTIRLDDFDACYFHDKSMPTKTKIMAFCPLDLPAEKYPLTESAKARYLHPRLRIDRCVDVGPYGSVVTGGELNYSLMLKNFSAKAYTVPVREKVPEGCELVSYTALPASSIQHPASNSQLIWNVPLAPGEERTLRWCVKVTAAAGNKVVSTGGTAAGIPSNTLVTEVVPRRISAAVARAWAKANIHNATNLPDCRVTGWAGGRWAKEPPRDVRVRDPHMRQLMEGDVVVVCPRRKQPNVFKLWVMGRGGLEELTPHGIRLVTEGEVVSLLAKDMFVTLRPAATKSIEDFVAREKAVVATAFAHHRKREFVQGQMPLSFVNDVFIRATGNGFCDPSTTSVSNLVENPPVNIVMFEYDCRKDPGQKRFEVEMSKMWTIIEPGDVVAFMTDHPTKKGKPGRCHAVLYVGDTLKDGHAQMLHASGDEEDMASALGRLNGGTRKSLFDGLLHSRNRNCLKDCTKVVVLRPLAL